MGKGTGMWCVGGGEEVNSNTEPASCITAHWPTPAGDSEKLLKAEVDKGGDGRLQTSRDCIYVRVSSHGSTFFSYVHMCMFGPIYT